MTALTKDEEKHILEEIRCLYCGLSPENLTCDGELPRSQVNARRKAINAKLKALFKTLGRTVTESEAFDYPRAY